MSISQDSRLQVTAFDRLQGSLCAAIMVFGFLFAVLFAIWWSHEFSVRPFANPDFGEGHLLPLTDVSLDDEDLMLVELPPSAAPPLSSEIDAVVDVVSTINANEQRSVVDGILNSEGSREIGPTGLGGDIGKRGIPDKLAESKRWRMHIESPDFDNYRQMLKFFDIEIGVVRLNSNSIIRVQNSGNGFQSSESDRKSEKTSFYFQNTKSKTRRWDSQIARDVDVDLSGSTMVHFYPEKTLQQLRTAESNRVAKDGKSDDEILKTEFMIVSAKTGFEFQVREITYR